MCPTLTHSCSPNCQQSADSHKGQVREFQSPSAPKAPEVPSSSDLSSQLEAYASSEPDHAEASSSSEASSSLTEGGDVHELLREAVAEKHDEAAH